MTSDADIDRTLLALHLAAKREIGRLLDVVTARVNLGLSRDDVAERMSLKLGETVSEEDVLALEKALARGELPRSDRLRAYAAALGCTIEIRFLRKI